MLDGPSLPRPTPKDNDSDRLILNASDGLGAINYGGPVVTASGLIFVAAPPDKMMRADDTRDGALVWQTELPAAGSSTPTVYSVNGKQSVVIAASSGRVGRPSSGEYVAFALP